MREDLLITTDIEAYLARHAKKEILRFLTAGSVDDGKSTLIGRLLHDSRMVYDDQLAALHRDSAKKSSAGGEVDYSLLVDGLLSEREQGITIDVAYRHFSTEKRKFIIADTPGHVQYTRNMATGASTADLAVILVDARQGVLPQTRRHSTIAALLGIRHIVVAINKMDLVGYDEAVFQAIHRDYVILAARLGMTDVHYMPISARDGDNVVERSAAMPWYQGPSLLEHLETVPISSDRNFDDLRFPVQLVIRPDLDFRGFSGTMASGVLKKGDAVIALPSGRASRVESIVTYDGELEEAWPPLAVVVRLADEIDLSRGDMLVHPDNRPHVGRSIDATVVWMHEQPMRPHATYLIKHGTKVVSAEVIAIHHKLDVVTLAEEPLHGAAGLGLNDIGRVTLTAARPLMFDAYAKNRATGAFILIDRLTNATVGAGMIRGPAALEVDRVDTASDAKGAGGRVTLDERTRRLGQRPAAVWLVGVTFDSAVELERRLFDDGYTACALGPDHAAIAGAKLLLDLGLIAIATAADDADPALAEARAALGDALVEVRAGASGVVAEALRALRTREAIR